MTLIKMMCDDGTEKIMCNRCQVFKYQETEFCKDDNMKLPICEECYYELYKDDIMELMNTYIELYPYKDVDRDELKEIVDDKTYKVMVDYFDSLGAYDLPDLPDIEPIPHSEDESSPFDFGNESGSMSCSKEDTF